VFQPDVYTVRKRFAAGWASSWSPDDGTRVRLEGCVADGSAVATCWHPAAHTECVLVELSRGRPPGVTRLGPVSPHALHGDAVPWVVFSERRGYGVLSSGGLAAPPRALPDRRGRLLDLPAGASAVYFDRAHGRLVGGDERGAVRWKGPVIGREVRIAVGTRHICWARADEMALLILV
jgi:hypothetical protein